LSISEKLALAGVFKQNLNHLATNIDDLNHIKQLFQNIGGENYQISFNGEQHLVISKQERGVITEFLLKDYHFEMPEIIGLAQLSQYICPSFLNNNNKFVRNDEEFLITSPLHMWQIIEEIGKKGVVIQRFKGLGEMNAEQLWETTLDPANRTLLQVKIDQFDEADETFSILMGNVVEPRREFIQENALKVVNLDV
jgi:DNA gyrase subunit B